MNHQEILEIILSRYIILFGGRYSRGKSLSITALNFFSVLMNNRTKFLSNMPFKYDIFNDIDIKPLVCTKQFDDLPKHINIIWDEIHIDLNTRNSMTTKNKYISIFSRDVAKSDAKLIGSLQFFDTLEKNMGLILEIIIIPEYINKYSENTKEDNKIRLEKKDFLTKWTIYDKREDNQYELTLNLYPFIFMYNTKYKPLPLFLNHQEFIDKLKKNEIETYMNKQNDELNLRIKNFNEGFEDIGKKLIR